jgi:hypothetical protein
MSLQSTSYTGALGTIRAHDQAAIDQFLLFAEQERQRLEADVVAAEMRCREADAQLAEVTHENRRVADELYAVWCELQAEHDRAGQLVSHRLLEVAAEAEELVSWSGSRPAGATLPPGLNRAASRPTRTWAAPPGELEAGPPIGASGGVAVEATAIQRPRQAFAFAAVEPKPAVAPADDVPHWTADVPVPPPGLEPARGPLAVADSAPPRPAPAPTPDEPGDRAFTEFWVEPDGVAMRRERFDGMLMSLAPMVALVIVLVGILAWIG